MPAADRRGRRQRRSPTSCAHPGCAASFRWSHPTPGPSCRHFPTPATDCRGRRQQRVPASHAHAGYVLPPRWPRPTTGPSCHNSPMLRAGCLGRRQQRRQRLDGRARRAGVTIQVCPLARVSLWSPGAQRLLDEREFAAVGLAVVWSPGVQRLPFLSRSARVQGARHSHPGRYARHYQGIFRPLRTDASPPRR